MAMGEGWTESELMVNASCEGGFRFGGQGDEEGHATVAALDDAVAAAAEEEEEGGGGIARKKSRMKSS